MRCWPFGSFAGDVVGVAVGLVLVPAVAILGLSLSMMGLLPPPGSFIFPLFLVPLGAALVAGGVLLLAAAREHARVTSNQALFVAEAGHELRTPLATLELLAHELATHPQLREQAERLAICSRSLRAGVERLLDWGRLASGRVRLRLEPVSLGAVLDEASRLVQPRLAQKAQTLVRTGCADAQAVGHFPSLVSALANLLSNASKYGPEGQTIELGMGHEGGWVTVWVQDRGPGISPAEQRKVFRPFYRGRGVVAEGVEGFGLGLAVVAQVVAAHGGKVTLCSREGRGAALPCGFRRRSRGEPQGLGHRGRWGAPGILGGAFAAGGVGGGVRCRRLPGIGLGVAGGCGRHGFRPDPSQPGRFQAPGCPAQRGDPHARARAFRSPGGAGQGHGPRSGGR